MGQAYDKVLIQLARSYKFLLRDNKLDIQLRMKTIGVVSWWTGLKRVY